MRVAHDQGSDGCKSDPRPACLHGVPTPVQALRTLQVTETRPCIMAGSGSQSCEKVDAVPQGLNPPELGPGGNRCHPLMLALYGIDISTFLWL